MPSGTKIPHYIFVASSDLSAGTCQRAYSLGGYLAALLLRTLFSSAKEQLLRSKKPLKTAINRSDCRTFRPQTHSKIQLVVHAPAIWQVQGYAAICSFQWVLCKGPP